MRSNWEDNAVKYLLMVRSEPAAWDQWENPSEDFKATIEFMDKLNKELVESGELVDAAGLDAPKLGKTVTKRGGRAVTLDGPYAEAKEVLGGYWILELASYQRAVEIATHVVENSGGPNVIEIREIAD